MSKLLFIDTNIYLDFYRIRTDLSSVLLEKLDGIKESIISTDQVEMEFKKNRQDAIFDGLKELKEPQSISAPPILRRDKAATGLETDLNKAKAHVKALRNKLLKAFENPVRNDKVYQVLQRIFNKKLAIDLFRKSEDRYTIRELAEKRFNLGYPPRKKNDTSWGDAINWEWIIHVAKQENKDILIVTRDTDYGVHHDKKGYVNDWLRQEFKERVHKKRSISLSPFLTVALKEFQVPITDAQEEEEEKFTVEKQHQIITVPPIQCETVINEPTVTTTPGN